MAKTEAYFSMQLSRDVKISFETRSQIINFYEAEVKRWERLKDLEAPQQWQILENARRAQQSRISDILKIAGQLPDKPDLDDKSYNRFRSEVSEHVEAHTGHRTLCSLLPADAAVLALIDTDPEAAAAGLAARLQQWDHHSWINQAFLGEVSFALNRFALVATGKRGAEKSWVSLHQKFESTVDDWRSDIEAAINDASASIEKAKALSAALDDTHATQVRAHENLMEKQEAALQALHEKYEKHMSLKTPVRYWRNRGWFAFGTAGVYLAIFIGAISILYILSAGLWNQIVLPNLPKDSLGGIILRDLDFTKTLLPAVPIILLLSVPVAWVLRHISRMFVESVSDYRDAMLRATMAETYLALVSIPEAKIGDAERAIVLQALFRPGASQPPEDGVPHPLVDLLAGIKAKN